MEDLLQAIIIENLENAEHRQLFHNERNRTNPFTTLSEKKFVKFFRLTKDLTRHLIMWLTPYMNPPIRASDLDIQTKVLVALKFFASGSYQSDIGSSKYFDLTQSTVSTCLREVYQALNHPDIFHEWVKFPSTFEELNAVRLRFFQQHNIPEVIGAIDCTHVAIFPPYINHADYPEYAYINRKHSLNVQLICDSQLKVLNVNAKYPGSTHDAFIWRRSNVQPLMRRLHDLGHTDYYLLGDSGYPLRPWLLTPLTEDPVPGTPEHIYNTVHKSTRSTIERCNGVLKGRFRCLLKHRVLHYHPDVACKIINACVVLHNMCVEYNIPEPDPAENADFDFGIMDGEEYVEDEGEELAMRRVNPELAAGRRFRRRVIGFLARN